MAEAITTSEKLGELKSNAEKLRRIGLTRTIMASIYYPVEMKEVSLSTVLLLFDAAYRLCIIKKFNPKVEAGDIIANKYFIHALKNSSC